jgi:hypothetical protein
VSAGADVRRSRIASAAAAALVASFATGGSAAEEQPPPLAGALPLRAGELVLGGEAGMIIVLPTLDVSAAVGLGGGVGVEARYRNIAVLGHAGALRLSWGRRIAPSVALGLVARTSITSLAQADGGIIGIRFSNLAIGNDWLVGGDVALTWLRTRGAHVTATLGPTFTLGGVRYTSFTDHAFAIAPEIRAMSASVAGEWPLRRGFDVVLRLDADVLLHTEIMPLGFIPTSIVGFAWAPWP